MRSLGSSKSSLAHVLFWFSYLALQADLTNDTDENCRLLAGRCSCSYTAVLVLHAALTDTAVPVTFT